MNKYVDYLNYRRLQKKSEDIGNILRPLGAPRRPTTSAPANYSAPAAPQPEAPQPTPQPVATPYRPPVATHLPPRDTLNRDMSWAQRFTNGFNGVKSSGLMDKIPAGVMTNDDFADKEMMDYNKGLPSATSPTYAPNVPWEKRPRSTGGYDLVQSYPVNGAEWGKGLPNVPAGKPTPNPTSPVRPGLPTAMTNDDFADKEMMDYNKGLPSATSPTYAPKPTPTPMPAAPVLPKPLGAKIGQERQSKLNRYIKALELLNS